MTADRVFNIFGSIVLLAIITTVVAHRNTARIVSSVGGTFVSSLRAAMGAGISPAQRKA